jgi:nitrate/nitrite transport system substrate-binding protein
MVHGSEMSRRQLLRYALAIGGVAVGGAAISACSPVPDGGPAGAPTALTIGFVPIACAAPLLAADALGAFEKQGLNVTLRKFSGWADLWTAYATGALDVAHMLSPMPIAADAGATSAARHTELLFTQNTNGQALTLASKHHPHVQSAHDLHGMVLGIPFEYSVHALLLRDYFAAHGMDPVSDVELRLLRPADMIAQLSVNTIDGFIGPEPFNQRALKTGSGRIFVPTKQMWDGHPCCSISLAKDVDHSIRGKLLAALREGASYVDNPAHAKESATMLAKEKYLNQMEGLIQPALAGDYINWENNQVTDPDMIKFGSQTSATAITWMAAQMARWGLGGDGISFDDDSIINAAQSVLPKEADLSTDPIMINGAPFDPTRPTAGYTA